MESQQHQRFPWRLFLYELGGTAVLVLVGLSLEIVSGQWAGWWIYWLGPLAGALLASVGCSFLAQRITVAKLYHFDTDRDGLFRRMSGLERAGEPSHEGASS